MANNWRIYVLILSLFIAVFYASDFLTIGQRISPEPPKPSVHLQRYLEGMNQEVAVHIISGEEKGPALLIFAGIHGDEAAGYLTADRYTNVKIKKGTLILVPRLNSPAVARGMRHGKGGDMNRLFHLSENSDSSPELKVVALAKALIQKADYVLNLHQADGFYSPTWISPKRNPSKWGQCNVIDAPIFDLPNGDKIELATFAQGIASSSNSKIKDRKFYFQVNNTNTASHTSLHKEQRKSLTYYALYRYHKPALGLESTKNCTLPQAVSFLTIVINSVIEKIGIHAEGLPSTDPSEIKNELRNKKIKL